MPNGGDHLLHFQYHGNAELSVPANVVHFSHLESWLDEICDRVNVDPKTRTQLQIVADEIFTNICSYAYPEHVNDGTVLFRCSFDQTTRELVLIFSDHGVDFNPLAHPISPAPHPSRKGGVGLLIVRNFADALLYERRDGHNVLTLRKTICK